LLISSVCTTSSPRSLQEICSTTGPTNDDLTQSEAYWELFGQGRQEGPQEETPSVAHRQLNRRCGPLSDAATAQIQGPSDLAAWLAANS
jgi:hypothetical protein